MSDIKQRAKRANRPGEAVYDTIREMAIEYRFRPDEKINEAELAERLGVSRTPVREALNRLLNEGLIHFKKNRGFHCRSLSATDLYMLAESRRIIEVSALPQIIARGTEEGFAALRQRTEEVIENLSALPPCERAKADEAFHAALIALTRNPVTLGILRNVNARVRFMRKILIEGEADPGAVFTEHLTIIDACAARDLAAASQAMEGHLALSESQAEAIAREGLGKIYLDKIHMDVDLAP